MVIVSVLVLAGLAVVTTVSGVFEPLGQREAVVHFKHGTPRADRARVRADCASPPAVVAEPMGPGDRMHARLNDVRYRVDHASNSQIATMSACLTKYPSVVGVHLSDMTS